MKKVVFSFLALFFSFDAYEQQLAYDNCQRCFPYSKNVTYHEAGNPDIKTITTDTLRALFSEWENKYLIHLNDGTAYVKNDEQDVGENGITTSEANGYGMVIEALMAGARPNSQRNFDALYAYARKHHIYIDKKKGGVNSPYLMSWKQFPNDKPDAYDSAVDGDLDMAYALLLAAVQWPVRVKYDYLDSAKKMLHDIIRYETDVAAKKFVRGSSDQVGDAGNGNKFIRTSDFMPLNIRAFAACDEDPSFWNSFLVANYKRFLAIQSQESPKYSLFPDYVYESGTGSFTVISNSNKSLRNGQDLDDGGKGQNHYGALYGFNACRVPWRIGLDYLITGDSSAKRIVDLLNTGVKKYTNETPCLLTNVLPLSDSRDDAAHFKFITKAAKKESADLNVVGPLCISAMADANKDWRTHLFQLMTDQRATMCGNANPKKLGQHEYYENTIRIICDIIITHNYWTPKKDDFLKP